ncbi:MAG: LamG domain-containing protein, partial [Verrucomicrobia bacterium]|nr:LamG domain-containing protein [Verrucomicrobiota bacterium]
MNRHLRFGRRRYDQMHSSTLSCARKLALFAVYLAGVAAFCSADANLLPSMRWWAPHTVSEGTLGLWHFDGTKAERFADASGRVTSTEAVGKLDWTQEGCFGSALAINGQTGALKVLLKKPLPGTTRLYVDAWVYLERYPETEGYLLFHPWVSGKQNEWTLLVRRDGSLTMRWLKHSAGTNAEPLIVSTAANAVPLKTWTYLAGGFRWDNKALLCVNGIEKGSRLFLNQGGVLDGLPAEKEAGSVWIGNNDALTKPWPGRIDELRLSADVVQVFPRPDNSWTDSQCKRRLTRGKPYTPDESETLFYASFDQGFEADRAAGDDRAITSTFQEFAAAYKKQFPQPGDDGDTSACTENALQPGVRGRALRYGVSFPQKDNISLVEGALEFWFQPLNWSNAQTYHVGIASGPFMLYVLNTGVLQPGGLPLVVWFNDKTYLPFGSFVFAPEEWHHVIVAWKGATMKLYLDGEPVNCGGPVGGTLERLAADWSANSWPLQLAGFNAYDELYIYNRMLTDEEAANCYWRYRDPAKLKPLPQVIWHTGYLPGSSALTATVDASRCPAAQSLRHEILDANGKFIWCGQVQTFPAPGRELVEKLPALADGCYTVRGSFLDTKGKMLSQTSRAFTVKHFPWENNDIGKKPIIIPPYVPIAVEGRHLKPWGRDILLGENGLPAQVEILGRQLLAAPVRLIAEQDGAEIPLRAGKVTLRNMEGLRVVNTDDYTRPPLTGAIPPLKLEASDGYQVAVSTKATLGALRADLKGLLDIDGWYQVKVTLSPDRPTVLDKLDLICDLTPDADTLYAQTSDRSADSSGYVNSSGEFGEIKRTLGEVWNSKSLPANARWKSFVPQVFIGTGER